MFFFFQAEDGIRDADVTGVQTCALPIYEEIEGWCAPTVGAKNEADLPAKARRYLERLEELIGTSFCLISTGAQRDETILCEDSPLMRWFPSVRSSLM